MPCNVTGKDELRPNRHVTDMRVVNSASASNGANNFQTTRNLTSQTISTLHSPSANRTGRAQKSPSRRLQIPRTASNATR